MSTAYESGETPRLELADRADLLSDVLPRWQRLDHSRELFTSASHRARDLRDFEDM